MGRWGGWTKLRAAKRQSSEAANKNRPKGVGRRGERGEISSHGDPKRVVVAPEEETKYPAWARGGAG